MGLSGLSEFWKNTLQLHVEKYCTLQSMHKARAVIPSGLFVSDVSNFLKKIQ